MSSQKWVDLKICYEMKLQCFIIIHSGALAQPLRMLVLDGGRSHFPICLVFLSKLPMIFPCLFLKNPHFPWFSPGFCGFPTGFSGSLARSSFGCTSNRPRRFPTRPFRVSTTRRRDVVAVVFHRVYHRTLYHEIYRYACHYIYIYIYLSFIYAVHFVSLYILIYVYDCICIYYV